MGMKKKQIQAISCGIFKREIEELIRSGKLHLPHRFLDSMLHMKPALLEDELQKKLTEAESDQIVLIFGDCQPRMSEMNSNPDIYRVTGMNCCEILLGKKKYYQLRSEGAFFLLPEWTERWEEVFQKHLGFNSETAKEFMGEMHTKLLYLDTGVIPVPQETLHAIGQFCGLPIEILKTDLNHLLSEILEAEKHLKTQK